MEWRSWIFEADAIKCDNTADFFLSTSRALRWCPQRPSWGTLVQTAHSHDRSWFRGCVEPRARWLAHGAPPRSVKLAQCKHCPTPPRRRSWSTSARTFGTNGSTGSVLISVSGQKKLECYTVCLCSRMYAGDLPAWNSRT